MKTVAMIPIALGSNRIPDKNLIMVDGFPMVYYVVDACKRSKAFDEIYINSESTIFKKIANDLGVKFYQRNSETGGSKCRMVNASLSCNGKRCQVHDHFIMDFISNISCDILVQVHTTSPLIRPQTISNFVKEMTDGVNDSLFSVTELKKETLINGTEVNFRKNVKTMTQNLIPVQVINWALSAWKTVNFKSNYIAGPTFSGNPGFFPISEIESIDVDTPEELFIAEACLSHIKRSDNRWFYYNDSIKSIERDLRLLIQKDGSPLPEKVEANNNLTDYNLVAEKMGNGSWCYPVVLSDNDQCCLIQQQPGEGCRKHYHTTKDEWWIVVKGSFKWIIGDNEREIHATEKQIVYLPKGTVHQIVCTSSYPGIRLAAGERNMNHVYVD